MCVRERERGRERERKRERKRDREIYINIETLRYIGKFGLKESDQKLPYLGIMAKRKRRTDNYGEVSRVFREFADRLSIVYILFLSVIITML